MGILLLALALRVAWAVAVPVEPVSDSVAYDAFARRLAKGLGYCWGTGEPTAYWPVGTSCLYSLVYRTFGDSYPPLVVLNVGLGIAVVGLSMILAHRWFGSRPTRIAGLVLCCWPLLIEYTTILGSELPFMVAMLVAWVVWTDSRPGLAGRGVIAGLALAAASYFRPTALLLPIVLAIPEVVLRHRLRSQLIQIILVGLVMAACLAPWVVRNSRVFGEFVLISTNGGVNTWLGNRPGTSGLFDEALPKLPGMTEAERDRYLAAEASAFIRRHPVQFAFRSLVKLVRLHERESIGVVWNRKGLESRFPPRVILAVKLISNLYWWAILTLGLVGVALRARSSGFLSTALHPALIVWAYFAAVHAITLIQDRHHMPSIPSIAMFAALALDRFFASTQGTARQHPLPTKESPA